MTVRSPAGTVTAPLVVVVALGRSAATKAVAAVMWPLLLNVMPLTVAPLIDEVWLNAPTPLTLKPEALGTLTMPAVVVVATGSELAAIAVVAVMWPCVSKVIPLNVPAVTLLAWPIAPLTLSSPRSRLAVAILAAVTVPSLSFAPSTPLAIFALVTARLAMAAVSTASSASSDDPTLLAPSCAALTLLVASLLPLMLPSSMIATPY